MNVVREPAPAKLNLFLHLVGRRDDGYHEIESLFVFLDLADVLEARRRSLSVDGAGGGDRLRIVGPWADALTRTSEADDNLIVRALAVFRERIAPLPPLDLTLDKRIPVAAGLGGGSADAAAALRIAARMAERPVSRRALAELALEIGADVPACLSRAPQRVSGIGEICRPVRLPEPIARAGVLLVNPRCAVGTAAVFRRFHESGVGFRASLDDMPWRRKGEEEDVFETLAQGTGNDLEAPAREEAPVVAEVLDALHRLEPSARLVRMSGSGATCFALFEDVGMARRAAERLADLRSTWWVAATSLASPEEDAPDTTRRPL